MKALPKNWLLPINSECFFYKKQGTLLCLLLFSFINTNAQIANYVSNGSFESLISTTTTSYYSAAYAWQPIDTAKYDYLLYSTLPTINTAPYSQGFQFPRSGNNFVISDFFCTTCSTNSQRGYLRNRLKQTLQAGITYCAKYHVVNTNNSPLAIDSYGVYFANSNLDTINYCNNPLTYLTPQIVNTSGIITDTLNWIAITGTFVATGNEKYMVLGNYKSNSATNTLLINPTYSATLVNDVCIDDVSVIELNLPAYAGADIYGIPSNTVYLGRASDVGIDEACMWYHLPNTTTAIDTAAGITVTVASTTNTYMVKQDICGMIKYDTVVVYPSAVGMNELEILKNNIKLFPNPANDVLNISFEIDKGTELNKVEILNNLGQVILEQEISFKNKNTSVNTKELPNGIYTLNLYGIDKCSITKKIVIAK